MTAADPWGLAARVAVVTGGGSGIGLGIAAALADAGARVAVLDRRGAAAAAAGLAGARGYDCDVSDPAAVTAVAAAVAADLGPVTVLVNNAGMIRPGALADLPLADWNALLAVNLTGYFLCAQSFAAPMRAAGGGSIVHIASIAAHHPTPMTGAYSVAKAGVAMLSRQIAVEWGPDGIRSNCVNPGMILTPLSQAMYDRPGVTAARTAAIPGGRIGTPADIAEAALFLASPRSAYVSGAEITVDGAFTRNTLGLIPRAGYDRQGG